MKDHLRSGTGEYGQGHRRGLGNHPAQHHGRVTHIREKSHDSSEGKCSSPHGGTAVEREEDRESRGGGYGAGR
jgi:hypothetical protein